MKTRSLFIFVLLVYLSTNVMAQYDSIAHDGLVRTYQLHLPTDYSSDTIHSLLIALHGGFGSGLQLELQTQLSEKADEENFIVVYPDGVLSPLGIRTWNAGTCCGYSAGNSINDVGFIATLMDSLSNNYSIDSLRVYVTGMSNGAMMSYRIACELSDRIAAIAPVAGTMTAEMCNAVNTLPIIHFHSYLDSNVPYNGGIGDGVSSHYNPPLDSVLNVWSSIDGCEIENDTLTNDSSFTHVIWNNCDCEGSIEYYITQDGGHSWPGGNQTIIGDQPSEVINANDLMWQFFEQHSLECSDVTSIEETQLEKRSIKVYPNPTTGTFILAGEKLSKVIVYNNEGKLVFEMNFHPSDILNINLTGEPIGNYFVRVTFSENKEEVIKVILQ